MSASWRRKRRTNGAGSGGKGRRAWLAAFDPLRAFLGQRCENQRWTIPCQISGTVQHNPPSRTPATKKPPNRKNGSSGRIAYRLEKTAKTIVGTTVQRATWLAPPTNALATLSGCWINRRTVVSGSPCRCNGEIGGSATSASHPWQTFETSASGRVRNAIASRPIYILNTPKSVSGIGAFRLAEIASPSTSRVWTGSITPSSQRRAVA